MATRNWTGLGDGTSWNDPANWDGGVPTIADDVLIDPASFINVSIPSDAQAASLAVRDAGLISLASSSSGLGAISATGSTVNFSASAPISVATAITLANSSTLTANNPGSTASLTIAASGTVQGSGQIDDNRFGYSGPVDLDNAGTINANVSSQTLQILTTTFINNGLAEATNGGRLEIELYQGLAWTNSVSGTISESNSILELSGPFTNAGQIIASGGTLNLDGTIAFGSIPVTWVNTGTITATNAVVNIAGNETVAQIGTLNRSGGQLNYVKGTLDNTGRTLDASTSSLLGMTLLGGTIRGGVLEQAGLGLVFGNNANNTLDGVTVDGDLDIAASGGVVLTGGTVVNNAAGTAPGVINVGASGTLALRNAGTSTIAQIVNLSGGGNVTADSPGGIAELVIAANGTVQGAGAIIDNVFGFSGSDNLTNLGTINANVNGQTLAIQNRFTAGTTFINHGLAEATNGGRLSIEENLGKAWTNAADGTISELNSTLELSGPFTNAGQIVANGGTLNLDGTTNVGSVPVTWVNTGTITATNAVVNIAGNETVAQIGTINRSGGQLNYVKGTLDNTGGTLDAATAALHGMTLLGGTIHGGTLDQSGLGLTFGSNANNTLDGVTVRGGLSLSHGWVILSGGTVVQNAASTAPGVIALDDSILTLRNGQPAVTLDQTVSLANASRLTAGIQGSDTSLTIGANGLVLGAGSIAAGVFPVSGTVDLDNLGTIDASINGQTLQVLTTTFVNHGLAQATNGGRLEIEQNRGVAWTNAASGIISETNSTLDLSGPFTNAGQIIANGGTLNLDGTTNFGTVPVTWLNSGTITATDAIVNIHGIESGSGLLTLGGASTASVYNGVATGQTYAFGASSQILNLYDPVSFQASLAGFEQGDLIVLRNRSVDTVTQAAGTLTLSFQGNVVATLNLQGDYSQVSFNANSDGQGNTLVGIGSTNHAPVFNSPPVTSSITASGAVSATGTIDFADLDAGDSASLQVTSRAVTATGADLVLTPAQSDAFANAFAVNPATGAWSFNVPASLAQLLIAGDSVQVTYTVTATDSHFLSSQQTETFSVLGGNDAPIITSPPFEQSITDDGSLISVSGALSFNDPDRGDSATASLNGPPQITVIGSTLTPAQEAALAAAFQITDPATGAWSFTFDDPAILPAGAVVTAAYQVAVTDTHGDKTLATETFHLLGENHTPVFNSPAIDQTIAEVGSAISAAGTIDVTDPDAGDTVSRLVTARAATATGVVLTPAQQQAFENAFTLDAATGAWTFNLTATDVQLLDAGQSVALSYTVSAFDNHGATSTQIEHFTIGGSSAAGAPPAVGAPATLGSFAGITTQISPVTIADPTVGALPVTVTVTSSTGLLAASAFAGHGSVSGTGTHQLTISGGLADVNTALASLTYFSPGVGQDTISVQAIDNNGQSLSRQIAVTTSPVPYTTTIVHGPGPQQIIAGMPTAVGGISVSNPYADVTGGGVVVDISTDYPAGSVVFNAVGSGGVVLQQGTDHIQIVGTTAQVNSYFDDFLSDAVSLGALASPLFKELIGVSGVKDLLSVIKILSEGVDPGTLAGLQTGLGGLINLPNSSLAPPAAFFKVGASAVAYDIASIIAAIPGSGAAPPSFEEFRDGLFKILSGEFGYVVLKKTGALPHIITGDGTTYDLHAVGEYVLALSTDPSNPFQVQGRFTPYNGSQSISALTEIGVTLGTAHRATFDSNRLDTVWIDGTPVTLPVGGIVQAGAGEVGRLSSTTYGVTLTTGEALVVSNNGGYLDVGIDVGRNTAPGAVIGLLGANAGAANDFILPDGSALPQPLTTDQLYNVFAAAWRVPQAFSLLDYGLGQTTATFTDPSFPSALITLDDLPQALVQQAAAVVVAAGITDPGAVAAAELDYIATGGNASIVVNDADLYRGLTTTPAVVTRSGAAPSVLGVIGHQTAPVPVAGSGPTQVTFDVYLTGAPAAHDIAVDFHVIAGGSGFLDAAAFGGTLPSGQVTISAGQSAAQITIDVPQGVLGASPTGKLAIGIGAPGGEAIFAPTAIETIVQPPRAGGAPDLEISLLTNFGTLTHDGNHYTLDLGSIGLGQPVPLIQLEFANAAAAGSADSLGGTFSVAHVAGLNVNGAALASPIEAGDSYQGLTIGVNTGVFDSWTPVKLGAGSGQIVFSPREVNATGYDAALDDVTIDIKYTLTPPTKVYSSAWGDVHIVTYDQVMNNFQGAGEFILAKSRVPGDSFEIQMRLEPWFGLFPATVITQAALAVGSDRLTFDIDRPDLVYLNGNPVSLSLDNPTLFLSGGVLTELTPTTFKVLWNTGEEATIYDRGNYVDIVDGVPPGLPGFVGGLQGFNEGAAADFQLADGTVLPQPLTAAELYGAYADAWRVTQVASLFDYDPGESTATFTIPNFPLRAPTLADFPADVVARAAAQVAAAGITDPSTRDATILDLIVTGDPSFLAGGQTQQQSGFVNNSVAATAAGGSTYTAVGVSAMAAQVSEAASGPTQVTFEAYLVGTSASDTVAHYTVIAPSSGFFGAADFGGTLPSGDVIIPAGQHTATFTIDVPEGALGNLPSESLEVQISSTAGLPVVAGIAQTEVINLDEQPGAPAVPLLALISGPGTLTHSGNDYLLDLGGITLGQLGGEVQLAIVNAAGSSADDLGGTFGAPAGTGFTIIGNSLPATIAPGGSYQGLYVEVPSNKLGTHSATLTFNPIDVNDSGYSAPLDTITLTIIDTVLPPAEALLNTPDTIIFQNVRLGAAVSLPVSITNSADPDAQLLDVTPTTRAGATVTGTITGLAPGATDTTSIQVGLDTSKAGAQAGYVTLSAASDDGQGSTTPILPPQIIDVFGSVYRTAAPSVTAPASTIVHVGDPGILSLTVANTAPADGYSETLLASIASTTGGFFPINGASGPIAAGANTSTLSVGFSTSTAGVLTGVAGLELTSDGGTGIGSIDGLGTIRLAPQSVPLSVTVNNFAVPELHETSGGGTFTRLGNAYTLDLGTIGSGSGPVVVAFDVGNAATGPADLLSGTVEATVSGPFIDDLLTFGGIGAGGSAALGTITLDTATAGTFAHTITVHPSGANASGFSAALADMTLTVTATIKGVSPTLDIAATDAAKLEGDVGATDFTFTVTRSGDTSEPSSVSYAVTGSGPNPADSGDFAGGVLPSGIVTFAPGEMSQTVHVAVSGDAVVEPDESFTVTLTSPTGATIATAAATGTIRNDDVNPPVNRPPIAVDDTATTSKGKPITIAVLANDSDPDNDALSVVAVGSPKHGRVTINADGTVTYAPSSGYTGSDHFDYTVEDGKGGSATATIEVAVSPLNHAPVICSGAIKKTFTETGRDISASGRIRFTDSDAGDHPTASVTSVSVTSDSAILSEAQRAILAAAFHITNAASGAWSFHLDSEDVAFLPRGQKLTIVETVTVDDGHGGTATQTETFVIKGSNEAPVITSDGGGARATVTANGGYVTTVVAAEADQGDHVTYAITCEMRGSPFTIDSATGELSLRSAIKPGAYSVKVKATDSFGASDTQTLKVIVPDAAPPAEHHATGEAFVFAPGFGSTATGEHDGTAAATAGAIEVPWLERAPMQSVSPLETLSGLASHQEHDDLRIAPASLALPLMHEYLL